MKQLIVGSITIACLGSTSAAIAVDLPDEILFCRTVADAVERAECYDRAVDALRQPPEIHETVANTPPKPPTPVTPVASTPTVPEPSSETAEDSAPVPNKVPTIVQAAEPVHEPVPDTPVSRDQVIELEQQVADLEQQVAVLEQGSSAASTEPVSSEDLFGKDESASRDIIQKLFGLGDVEQIEATVTEVKRTTYGKLVMVLNNGQIWKQLDSSRLTVRTGDGVLIKSARLGSFLLEKQTGSRSIRVRRVD